MANNAKRMQEIKRRENKKRYELESKRLIVFPIIGFAAMLVVALMFFMKWASVYNSDIGGDEVAFTGFNCLTALLTGNFSGTEESLGDIAIPFYYYAKEWVVRLSVLTLVSLIVTVIALVWNVIVIAKQAYSLSVVSAALSGIVTVLLLACFVTALSMSESDILSTYCSGNPACSIDSMIIVPAVVSLIGVGAGVWGTVKYGKIRQYLE